MDKNWNAYRKNAKHSLLDASEMELWTQWLLPDYPTEKIAAAAGRLTRLFRDVDGRRVPRDDVKSTLLELRRARLYAGHHRQHHYGKRKYPTGWWRMALRAALSPSYFLPRYDCANPIPPSILSQPVRSVPRPECCAYIGDNPIRDVEGTRAAGFGMMIRIDEPDTISKEPQSDDYTPDYTVQSNLGNA